MLKFTKGHYSVESVGEVTVLILFTSSDNALHLYQALLKYLKGLLSLKIYNAENKYL